MNFLIIVGELDSFRQFQNIFLSLANSFSFSISISNPLSSKLELWGTFLVGIAGPTEALKV